VPLSVELRQKALSFCSVALYLAPEFLKQYYPAPLTA
jgi:hypothetical protein